MTYAEVAEVVGASTNVVCVTVGVGCAEMTLPEASSVMSLMLVAVDWVGLTVTMAMDWEELLARPAMMPATSEAMAAACDEGFADDVIEVIEVELVV